ncbi:MAG: hypothetical protein QW692_00605 [Nitrososphaerota archaeon]
MAEDFSLKIILEGVDDASDEIQSVTEGLRRLGINNEAVAEKAKEVVKESREQHRILKAVAEESQIFSNEALFAAKQLNNIASFAGKVNNLFTQWNTLQTRINTAQIALNSALEEQARVLDKINARFGTSFKSVEEAIAYLQEYRGEIKAAGGSTKEVDAYLKELEGSMKNVERASKELAAAQQQMNAQMITMGIQAIGLVPQFMNVVNSISTLKNLFGAFPGVLNAVKMGFTGLYAAMGPIGLILMAIGAILPIIIAYWDDIAGALKAAGEAVWSVIGPALEWLWNNILKPLGEFLYNVFRAYIQSWIDAWNAVVGAVTYVADAIKGALEGAADWFNQNVVQPIQNAFAGAAEWIDQNLVQPVSNAMTQVRNEIVNKLDEAQQLVGPLFQHIKDQWGLDLPKTQELVSGGLEVVKLLMEGKIGEAVAKAGELMGQLPDVIWEWLMNAKQKVEEGLNYIKSVFENIWNGICNVVKGAIDKLKSWIQGLIDKAKEAFEWLYKKLTGGSIVPDMWRDIVTWTSWGVNEVNRMIADLTYGVAGPKILGGVSIAVTVNAAQISDPRELAEIVSREIVRRLRGIGA